jgi:hypothetical protein
MRRKFVGLLIVPSLIAAVLAIVPAQAEVKQAIPNRHVSSLAIGPLGVGPGNACSDNTLVSNSNGVLKVKACVGERSDGWVYSYSEWRCGKPVGQSGYQNCNLGIHNQGLLVAPPNTNSYWVSILSDGAVGVQTKNWAGPASSHICPVEPAYSTNTTLEGGGTNLASVRFSANPNVLYQNLGYSGGWYYYSCSALG